jgi:Uma2 family endonuclease
MTVTLAKWSLEQYHQMIELGVLDDRNVELLNGEIVEMPSEGPEHAYFSTKTADLLRQGLAGKVQIREAHPITLSEQASEPEPDIAVVALPDILYLQRHPYPEDVYLLVEYANTSLAKDKSTKRQLYAKTGILEYWLINLQDRQLMVHRTPQGNDYQSVQTLTSGTIDLLAFPGVTIDITQLL